MMWRKLRNPAAVTCCVTCLISLMLSCRSETANSPHSLVSCKMLSRVTPGSIVPSKGGVISSLTLLSACTPGTNTNTHLACMADAHCPHSMSECCSTPDVAFYYFPLVARKCSQLDPTLILPKVKTAHMVLFQNLRLSALVDSKSR